MTATEPQISNKEYLLSLIDAEFPRIEAEVEARLLEEQAAAQARGGWPAYGKTVHPVTGFVGENVPLYTCRKPGKNFSRVWAPRSELEYRAVLTDEPRWVLLRGGEGSAKSTAAVIKALERCRRGMSGILASPDFEHLKESVWPLFCEWCPADVIDKTDRHMLEETWEAQRKFELHLRSQAGQVVTLRVRGIDNPETVRGGNVHFVIFDEASRHQKPEAFKFLGGRARLVGPAGEKPQVVMSTTPAKHWLYDYFGPLKVDESDPFEKFKASALDVKLRTEDNIPNLDSGFVEERTAMLTEAERRVYMEGEWEDLTEGTPFLEDIRWWEACFEPAVALTKQTPLLLAVDAGVSKDCFGLVGVSTHYRPMSLAVRLVKVWVPKGKPLDFDDIEDEIKNLCLEHNVLKIVYDPYQLHQMMTGLRKPSKTVSGRDFPGVVTQEFKQGQERAVADKGLLDLIQQRRIVHDGNQALREHVKNADRKLADDGRNIRIVKRTAGRKIDLCVALSMACQRGLMLWRPKPRIQGTSAASVF